MLPDIIDLAVDSLNNGTPSTESFKRHIQELNRTVYTGPNYSVANPNTMTVYRTPAKRSGSYLGSSKSAIKLSSQVSVMNAEGVQVPAAMIGECSFSIPVGVTPEVALALRQRLIAAIDHSFATSLVDNLAI